MIHLNHDYRFVVIQSITLQSIFVSLDGPLSPCHKSEISLWPSLLLKIREK